MTDDVGCDEGVENANVNLVGPPGDKNVNNVTTQPTNPTNPTVSPKQIKIVTQLIAKMWTNQSRVTT